MKVKLPSGREIKVWVQHVRTDLELSEVDRKLYVRYRHIPVKLVVLPHTIVELTENELSLGRGISYCHPSDNFCKRTGIKTALKRIPLKDLLNKEDRKVLWESVLHLRKGAKVGNGQAIREE